MYVCTHVCCRCVFVCVCVCVFVCVCVYLSLSLYIHTYVYIHIYGGVRWGGECEQQQHRHQSRNALCENDDR